MRISRLVRQHQPLHHQLGVGLLRIALDHDPPLERRHRPAAGDLLEQRLATMQCGTAWRSSSVMSACCPSVTRLSPVKSPCDALAFEAREQAHPAQHRPGMDRHRPQLCALGDVILGRRRSSSRAPATGRAGYASPRRPCPARHSSRGCRDAPRRCPRMSRSPSPCRHRRRTSCDAVVHMRRRRPRCAGRSGSPPRACPRSRASGLRGAAPC